MKYQTRKIAITTKRRKRARSYLLYKFPSLHLLLARGRGAQVSVIVIFVILVALAFYYMAFGHEITPNGVLDAVIATPIQTVIIIGSVAAVVWMRVAGYRHTKGIARYDYGVRRKPACLPNVAGYPYLPLYEYADKNLVLDCSEISSMSGLHPFMETMLRFTVFDKEDLYRLEAGSLDIPKATLRSISIESSTIIIKLGSTSFFNIFYTHYFGDYPLSTDSYDENNKHPDITLRYIFGEMAEKFICDQTKEFNAAHHLYPYPIFPNPLGVTGICRVAIEGSTYVIARRRKSDVINEVNKLDWTFSGLVEAHKLLYATRSLVSVTEYIIGEIKDELLNMIGWNEKSIASVTPIGIIFSEKYLYQPELVVIVDLKAPSESAHSIGISTPNYELFLQSDIDSVVNRVASGESKDLFHPITLLFKEWIAIQQ